MMIMELNVNRGYSEAAKPFSATIVRSEKEISMKTFLPVIFGAGARISSEEGSLRSEYIDRYLLVLQRLIISEEKK
jgi:hypothetical protein